jgi:hypothetical protein
MTGISRKCSLLVSYQLPTTERETAACQPLCGNQLSLDCSLTCSRPSEVYWALNDHGDTEVCCHFAWPWWVSCTATACDEGEVHNSGAGSPN